MSTSPTPAPPSPTLPLAPDARKAYTDLYAKNEAALENTTDGVLLQSLNDSQLAIGGVISADNEYRLNQDTAQFNALLKQIGVANTALKKLQSDIGGVATKLSIFGDVAAGIETVLTLVPGI